ncbi:hypothetical protein CLVI_17240 [Clostridium vincentii]|uniref:Transporter n=2 Tax=Clostridium vincentii TaxID=52704 RepID=A0A2T0BES3_9CLOT|nr:hypothetical protein CLVI_17240 [Clostridium vincentii]
MNIFNKKPILYEKLSNRVIFVIRGIEIFLAVLLIILVLISALGLVITLYKDMGYLKELVNYDTFQELTSFMLLLIIALELSMMLVKHNPNNVIGVMIYAMARKMLIYNTAAIDMLIGVITLAILFLVKIYLIKDNQKQILSESQSDSVVSSSLKSSEE